MTNSLTEIWKDIPGYEKYYMISNLGRVRSKDRITRNGNGECLRKGKMLKTFNCF